MIPSALYKYSHLQHLEYGNVNPEFNHTLFSLYGYIIVLAVITSEFSIEMIRFCNAGVAVNF